MQNNREWRSDPDAETILRDVAMLPYTTGTIRLNDIDWSESANNCARLSDPLNSEKIEDYASGFRRGDVFPRIVVERHKKNGLYVILGGNQRSSALKSIDQNAEVECYVVDPLTNDERELVIRSLNSRHGWGSTKEERVEHAVYLVRRYGMHVDTVAKAMCVSDYTIRTRIHAEDERARLAKAGIDSSKMPIRSLVSIASINDIESRNNIAKAALETKSTGDKVAALVCKVANSKSKAEASKVIAEHKKNADAVEQIKKNRGGGKLKKPRRDKFLNLLTLLADFLENGNDGNSFSTLEELTCSVQHDLDNLRVLSAKINARLQCICESGK